MAFATPIWNKQVKRLACWLSSLKLDSKKKSFPIHLMLKAFVKVLCTKAQQNLESYLRFITTYEKT